MYACMYACMYEEMLVNGTDRPTIHADGQSCSTTDGIPLVGSQILGEIAVGRCGSRDRKEGLQVARERERGKGRASSSSSSSCSSGRQQQGLSDRRKGGRSAGGYPMAGTDREQRLSFLQQKRHRIRDKRAIQTGNKEGRYVCMYVSMYVNVCMYECLLLTQTRSTAILRRSS